MLKKILMSSLCASTMLMAQSGAGINVNEDDVEIEATIDSRNIAALHTSSTIYLADFNFLNIEEGNDKLKLFGAGVGATNKLEGVEGVELTFGAKFVASNIDIVGKDDWHTAFPLMGIVRYTFPPLMFNIPPISIETKFLYAPGALSFGDAENYSEFRFSADIEMIENVKIYGGYRNIKTGFDTDDDFLFSNGFYGGLKFTY